MLLLPLGYSYSWSPTTMRLYTSAIGSHCNFVVTDVVEDAAQRARWAMHLTDVVQSGIPFVARTSKGLCRSARGGVPLQDERPLPVRASNAAADRPPMPEPITIVSHRR